MRKLSDAYVKESWPNQLSFLKTNFSESLRKAGGEAWFKTIDAYERDQFVKECIDKHNALSTGAIEDIDLNDQPSVHKQLLEAIKYQNRLLTE